VRRFRGIALPDGGEDSTRIECRTDDLTVVLGKDVDREEEAVSHAGELAELERLVTARVAALTRPGRYCMTWPSAVSASQLRPTPVNDNAMKPEEVRNARRS
jgi:hypothetical protein